PDRSVIAQSPPSINVNGKHLMIPISALSFGDDGKLSVKNWPPYSNADNQKAVDPFLSRLFAAGLLRASANLQTKPSFMATAVTPGESVLIEIEIKNVVPSTAVPADTKADFTVTESETYTGLEPGKLKDTIGTTSGGGKKPGLVFVSSAGAPDLPKAGTYAMAGDPATVDIPKDSGAAGN